jgi:hypothetical protein
MLGRGCMFLVGCVYMLGRGVCILGRGFINNPQIEECLLRIQTNQMEG